MILFFHVSSGGYYTVHEVDETSVEKYLLCDFTILLSLNTLSRVRADYYLVIWENQILIYVIRDLLFFLFVKCVETPPPLLPLYDLLHKLHFHLFLGSSLQVYCQRRQKGGRLFSWMAAGNQAYFLQYFLSFLFLDFLLAHSPFLPVTLPHQI